MPAISSAEKCDCAVSTPPLPQQHAFRLMRQAVLRARVHPLCFFRTHTNTHTYTHTHAQAQAHKVGINNVMMSVNDCTLSCPKAIRAINTCTRMHTHRHTHIRTRMHAPTHMHTHTHAHTHMHAHTHTQHTHVCTHT